MNRSRMSALVLAALLTGGVALAQTQSTGATPTPPPDNGGDTPPPAGPVASMQFNSGEKLFLKSAMEADLAEIELAKAALEKSSANEVKDFAQHMIQDHTMMCDQMKTVAKEESVEIPTQPSKKSRSMIAKMRGLSGADFDQAYLKQVIKDHKTDLHDFQQEAFSGQHPDVKSAASQESQMISQHLQAAEQVAKDQNVTLAGK